MILRDIGLSRRRAELFARMKQISTQFHPFNT
jgi:hypothetical protein